MTGGWLRVLTRHRARARAHDDRLEVFRPVIEAHLTPPVQTTKLKDGFLALVDRLSSLRHSLVNSTQLQVAQGPMYYYSIPPKLVALALFRAKLFGNNDRLRYRLVLQQGFRSQRLDSVLSGSWKMLRWQMEVSIDVRANPEGQAVLFSSQQ
jgi:hypothetical protein